MNELDTTTPQPSQTVEPLRMALELGLTLVPFASREFVGMDGQGKWVRTRNLYWMKNSDMHSGPFKAIDQALDFLYRWYTEFYLRYQQGEDEEMDE